MQPPLLLLILVSTLFLLMDLLVTSLDFHFTILVTVASRRARLALSVLYRLHIPFSSPVCIQLPSFDPPNTRTLALKLVWRQYFTTSANEPFGQLGELRHACPASTQSSLPIDFNIRSRLDFHCTCAPRVVT